jgi:translation initiation factor IF-2
LPTISASVNARKTPPLIAAPTAASASASTAKTPPTPPSISAPKLPPRIPHIPAIPAKPTAPAASDAAAKAQQNVPPSVRKPRQVDATISGSGKTLAATRPPVVGGAKAPAPLPARPVAPVAKAPPSVPPAVSAHHAKRPPKQPPSLVPAGAAAPEAAPAAPVVVVEKLATLTVRPPIVVRDFAIALNLRPFRLVSELMEMGIFASMVNSIDEQIAIKIARKHGIALEIRHRGESGRQAPKVIVEKPDHDDPKFLKPRPPVVCVLGHVDHGKTTLLDYYRKTNVVSGEAGGITQHVGAYTVEHDAKRITFLDTPGHAAFSKMRERGAEITDIAILVVAADDGFMPQTDEALKFAQKNNVQIVVAINKSDAKGANIDRIKQQMQQRGIASEDWGGTVLTSAVSALKGDGMGELLDNLLLQAEMMELRANPSRPAEGTVIEAQMETGRGPTASVIVQRGTLKPGDALVCGEHYCKVRALFDEGDHKLSNVAHGNPALVLGWSGVPSPGAVFQACKNEKEARQLAEENTQNLRKALDEENDLVRAEKVSGLNRLSDMDRLLVALAQNKEKVLKVVCKADVNGTLEALIGSLESIKSAKVKLEVVASSVGPVTPNDVNVAHAANAIIVAFDVKQEIGVPALLKSKTVRVISHNIIYMLLDLVREEMTGLLDPVLRENRVGLAEIRQIFPFGKNGQAAGCMVSDGNLRRDFKARLLRPTTKQQFETIYESVIDTLRRFKDDVTEVKSGYECGVRLNGYDDYKPGDQIECFEILQERPTLN